MRQQGEKENSQSSITFSRLPTVSLSHIACFIGFETLFIFANICHVTSAIVRQDALLWRTLLRCHFPADYRRRQRCLPPPSGLDNRGFFQRAYRIDYKDLSSRNKLLLSYAKEGNLESIKNSAITLHELISTIHDKQNRGMVFWASYNHHQQLLDCFFRWVVPAIEKEGARDLNQRDNYYYSALHWAAACNKHTLLNQWIQRADVPINISGPNEYTPLYLATYHGHTEVIACLLTHPDIDVNVKLIEEGITPYSLAVRLGYAAIVQLLWEHPRLTRELFAPIKSLQWAMEERYTEMETYFREKVTEQEIADLEQRVKSLFSPTTPKSGGVIEEQEVIVEMSESSASSFSPQKNKAAPIKIFNTTSPDTFFSPAIMKGKECPEIAKPIRFRQCCKIL